MGLAPYDRSYGQIITNDAGGSTDRAFLAHYAVAAADAAAESDAGVMALTELGAEAATVTTGFINPAVPRNVKVDGSAANITGNVKVYGTNFAGDAISETIALNGVTAVAGNLAFKTVTKVDLPARVNTPAAQVETATAAGTVTTAGNALVTVTSKLYAAPVAVDVPVELNDDAAAIALAIRTALAADPDISEHFTVGGETDAVILTAKIAAANDSTLNIAIDDGTGEGASEGVTTAATSANTTAGVAPDKVSVGVGKKFGIPYKLAADELVIVKLFDNSADSGAVTADATDLEKNVIALNGTPDGLKPIALYILV